MSFFNFIKIKFIMMFLFLVMFCSIFYVIYTDKYIFYITSYIEKKMEPVLGKNTLTFDKIKLVKDNVFYSFVVNNIQFKGDHSIVVDHFELRLKKGWLGLYYKIQNIGISNIDVITSNIDVSNTKDTLDENVVNIKKNKEVFFNTDFIFKASNTVLNICKKIYFFLSIDNITINNTEIGRLTIEHYLQAQNINS